MNLNDYQSLAHTTSCHGGTLAYPLAALSEECGEVQAVWGDWVRNAEYLNIKYDSIKEKLVDELGDVCWDLAEVATLLNIDIEYIDKYASANHVSNSVSISYYICQLGLSVGKINGIWAKYIRKHDGFQPNVEEIASLPLEGDHNLRSALAGGCILVLHSIRNIVTRIGLDFDEILDHNLKKLADRKVKNTLGGIGSVDTRSSL